MRLKIWFDKYRPWSYFVVFILIGAILVLCLGLAMNASRILGIEKYARQEAPLIEDHTPLPAFPNKTKTVTATATPSLLSTPLPQRSSTPTFVSVHRTATPTRWVVPTPTVMEVMIWQLPIGLSEIQSLCKNSWDHRRDSPGTDPAWDLCAKIGTPVRPIARGVVIFEHCNYLDLGCFSQVYHRLGRMEFISTYAGLDTRILVSAGQEVGTDTVIGYVGQGKEGYPALHLALEYRGNYDLADIGKKPKLGQSDMIFLDTEPSFEPLRQRLRYERATSVPIFTRVATRTVTPSATATRTATMVVAPSASPSNTASPTNTADPTATATVVVTATPTITITILPSSTPTVTILPSATATVVVLPTATIAVTATVSGG